MIKFNWKNVDSSKVYSLQTPRGGISGRFDPSKQSFEHAGAYNPCGTVIWGTIYNVIQEANNFYIVSPNEKILIQGFEVNSMYVFEQHKWVFKYQW